VKLLEVRLAYLDDDEQGVFDDVDEIQLEEWSNLQLRSRRSTTSPDLDGLHGSEHTGRLADPLSPCQLLPDPVS